MILIYSKQNDEFVNDVIDYLSNYSFIRISKGNDIEYVESIFETQKNNSSLIKNKFTQVIDFQKIKSAWFNGGFADLTDASNNTPELNQLLLQNLNIVVDSLLESKDIKKIGDIKNNKQSNKIYNLLIAKKSRPSNTKNFNYIKKTKINSVSKDSK